MQSPLFKDYHFKMATHQSIKPSWKILRLGSFCSCTGCTLMNPDSYPTNPYYKNGFFVNVGIICEKVHPQGTFQKPASLVLTHNLVKLIIFSQ